MIHIITANTIHPLYLYLSLVYINHRPVFGLSPNEIKQAFKLIGNRENIDTVHYIEKGKLFELVQKKGIDIKLMSSLCKFLI